MRGRSHRRRGFAIIAALLLLLGFEVLPNLHLAFHDADHTHAHDGSIVLARAAHGHHHDHGDADHHHDVDAGRDRSKKPVLAFDHAPHGHTAAGLAHRLTAWQQPPAPVIAPVATPDPQRWTHAAPRALCTLRSIRTCDARGPPDA